MKFLVCQIQGVKNLYFKISDSTEILGFSFEILGISKICDNRISYNSLKKKKLQKIKKLNLGLF